MKEFYLKNNTLISEKEWVKEINSLKSGEAVKDKRSAKRVLKKLLVGSVERRIPERRFGIFFSGGVDSGLIASICKRSGADFVCYGVGFQDEGTKIPEDITEARKVAKQLNLRLRGKIYNLKEAEKIIKETTSILKKVNKGDVVNVGVGSVVLAAIGLGKKDKIDCFFSGLGSEEIFAGYERHVKAKCIDEECWKGLKEMWSRDLVRDFNLAKKLGVEIRTPFLDKELIKFGMKIPGEWKLGKKGKKIILREVAEEWLGDSAWRPKKAAQYGSCFDKALGKLAKAKGFRLKKDYLDSIG